MTRKDHRNLISDSGSPQRCRPSRLRLPVTAMTICLVVTVAGSCDAWGQLHRGPRGRGAIVVAPPIFPTPYLDDPFYGRGFYPPPILEPPSGVRVRTPFFSLNIDPGGYMPPRGYHGRYEAYRPYYDHRRGQRSAPPANAHPYRPGADGGLPEITSWPVAPPAGENGSGFSRGQLRRSASMLRAGLSVRGEEGQVWLDYLQPEAVVAAAEGRFFEFDLIEMAQRYEGVTTNPDLGHIRTLPGFETTKDLLAVWARQLESNGIQPSSPGPLPADDPNLENRRGEMLPEMPLGDDPRSAVETLPAPLPQAEPQTESRAEPL